MASLNIPIPGEVKRVASDLYPKLTPFKTVRDRYTLVAKRLDDDAWRENPARVRERLRQILDHTAPFSVRIDGIDYFAEPPAGSAPVVYFDIDSPGLHQLHGRLCREFPAVEGIEGPEYTPHITLARGATLDDAERLATESFDPIEWTVSEAVVWDRQYREAVDRFTLRG